jgi:glycosyltransferase involved in cell wall biosynthesis
MANHQSSPTSTHRRKDEHRRTRIGFLSGLFYIITPAIKPALRATVGRSPGAWSFLKGLRDRLIRGAPMPDGLEAPASDRARSTFRSWFGTSTSNGAGAAINLPFGANVAGYFSSEKGTGEAARSAAAVLKTAGVPVVLNNVVDASSANVEDVKGVSRDNPYAINLVYVNADQAANFAWHKGEGYFRGRHSIGVWNWEVQEFPEEWVTRFEYFDEVWAGTNFAAEALARVSPVPVMCMPYAINSNPTVAQDLDLSRFGVSSGSFVFLFMFDFHSVMERKNPLGLIQAFKSAFGEDDNVTLLLKSSHADMSGVLEMKEAAAGARVSIIDTVVSREEVNALYGACDCYVSLHRSEGFGLTIAEAMVAAKPVIATGFSGNMDFMTSQNSYPVRYKMKEIERDYPPYRKGWHWAEPDINHAAELMLEVYHNRHAAAEVGKSAREDIVRLLSPEAVGERMKARLREVVESGSSVIEEQVLASADKEDK